MCVRLNGDFLGKKRVVNKFNYVQLNGSQFSADTFVLGFMCFKLANNLNHLVKSKTLAIGFCFVLNIERKKASVSVKLLLPSMSLLGRFPFPINLSNGDKDKKTIHYLFIVEKVGDRNKSF